LLSSVTTTRHRENFQVTPDICALMLTMSKTLGKMIYGAIIANWFILATPRRLPGRALAMNRAFD
jgi:hypothetical protein